MARGRNLLSVLISFCLLFAQFQIPAYASQADTSGPAQESAKPLIAPGVTAQLSASLLTDLNGNRLVNPGDTIRYTGVVENTGPGSAGNVRFTDQLDSNTSLVAGSVRASPLASDLAIVTDEDTPLSVTLSGSSATGGPVTLSVGTGPTHGSLSGAPPTVQYTPVRNFFGTDSFLYSACGDVGLSVPVCDTGTVSITIGPVNDAPSFVKGSDQTVGQDSGGYVLPGWATAIQAGPANESGQLLTFAVTGNSDPTLFAAGPSVDSAGALTFTPAPTKSGSATVSIRLTDNGGTASGGIDSSAVQTFSITVRPSPIATGDTYSVSQGSSLSVAAPGVLANDTLNGGTIVTYSASAHGAVTLASDGAFTYTPTAGHSGPDSFTYTLRNVAGDATATVSLYVYAAPVAVNDDFSTVVNTPLLVLPPGVLANDNANSAVISASSTPSHGTVVVSANGEFAYSPEADYWGADSFTYTLSNIAGASTATVNLYVYAPPAAVDDSYQVGINTPLTVAAPGVFENDTRNGATPSVTVEPSHGSVLLSEDGSFTYTPEADFTGSDSFEYSLTNPAGTSAATVSLQVLVPPLANNDSYNAVVDTTLAVPSTSGVLANDVQHGALITAYDATSLQGGTILLAVADGSFSYAPPAGYVGPDSFTYTIANLSGSDSGTVSIFVYRAPTASNDAYDIAQNTPRVVTAELGVLANDSPNNAALSLVTPPAHGTVSLNANGSFTYTPSSGYFGSDSFGYALTNPAGSATATVSLTVWAPPVAGSPVYVVQAGLTRSVPAPGLLAGNAAGSVSLSSHTSPANGVLTVIGADGRFGYAPSPGFVGTDSFEYTLANYAGTSTGTVTLSVRTPPTAVTDSYVVTAGQTLTVPALTGLLANDTGTQPLTAVSVTAPSYGSLSALADGSFGYTPYSWYPNLPTESGEDGFQYVVSNGTTDATGTVHIVVVMPPVAASDTYSATGGVGISVPASAGVLTNDTLPAQVGPTVLTSFGPSTGAETTPGLAGVSASGGTLTLRADGSFDYDAPASATFTGTDTFKYTIRGGSGLTRVGTVTITVPNRIFFLQQSATTSGDGRLSSPFKTLAAFNSAAGSRAGGGVVFVYAGLYTGNLSLKNGERLIGQAADLSANLPFTLAPHSVNLPPATTAPAISATSGTVVSIANDNVIRGLSVSATSSASAVIGDAAHGGTTTLNDVSISVTGTGRGLALTSQSGTFSTATSQIACASTGACVDISGAATANLTFNSTPITQTTGRLLNVSGKTGGTVTFGAGSPLTQSNGAADAITITGNTGTSTVFNAPVSIVASGSSARGLYVYNGGTVTLPASTASTIRTSGSAAVEVYGSVIDLTLRSVNATGGSKGISVRASSGRFAVTGDGTTAGSGGTIQSITGRGAEFVVFTPSATEAVSLKNMNFTNTAQNNGAWACGLNVSTGSNSGCNAAIHLEVTRGIALDRVVVDGSSQLGVNGIDVTDFSMTNSSVLRAGNEPQEHGVVFHNLKGTASLTTTTVSGNRDKQMYVDNDAGTLALTVTGSTFSNGEYEQGLDIYARGNSSITANVTNSTFSNLWSYGITAQAAEGLTGNLGVTVDGGTFATNGGAVNIQGSGGTTTYTVKNITATSRTNGASAIVVGKPAGAGSMSGTITGNVIGTTGVAGSGASCGGSCNGIQIDGYGTGGQLLTSVTNNRIQHVDGDGILVTAGGTASVATTITGNKISDSDYSATASLYPRFGIRAVSADTACLAVTLGGLASATAPSALADAPNSVVGTWSNEYTQTIRLTKRTTANLSVPGWSGIIENWVSARNGNAGVSVSGTPIGTSTCGAPLLAAGGAGPGDSDSATLTALDLEAHLVAARAIWESAGISAAERAALAGASAVTEDLAMGRVGEARGSTVVIDPTAAGWGWHADASSPTAPTLASSGRVDLLTVLTHELGHLIGRVDLGRNAVEGDVMTGTIETGTRNLKVASAGAAAAAAAGELIDIGIGTLQSGELVVIVFDVVVNESIPVGVSSVTTQGSVTGDSFPPLLTSDPTNPVPQSPTVMTVTPRIARVFLPMMSGPRAVAARPDLVVERIRPYTNGVEVVIRNQGSATVTDEFWVDLYLAPNPAPSKVNQTWPTLSSGGMVWAVTSAALPLAPGASLTLRDSGQFYRPDLSRVNWPLAVGTAVYVQVDSANDGTSYGAVLESDETGSGVYNNIGSASVSVGLLPSVAPSGSVTAAATQPDLPRRPQ